MIKPISENNSQNSQNRGKKQPNPLILALVLTGILAWEMYPALIHATAANAGALKHSLAQLESQEQPAAVSPKISYSGLALNSLTSEPGNLAESTRQNPSNQLPATLALSLIHI
ncbi:hypothetical protein C7B67_06350, partial [filamentous cyanobacterium Phorm 6]